MIALPDIDEIEAGVTAWPSPRLGFGAAEPAAAPKPGIAARAPPGGRAGRRALFYDDFDLPPDLPPAEEPEIIEPSFTLAEYEAARAEAHEAGRAEERALREAAATAADRVALAAIAGALDRERDGAAEVAEAAAEAIAGLMLGMLAAAFPTLCARHGADEARALAAVVLPALRDEPRPMIRVAPDAAEPVRGLVAAADPELLARMDLRPDPALSAGDVRITWRGGEARRDARALWQAMGDILGQSGWPMPPLPEEAPGASVAETPVNDRRVGDRRVDDRRVDDRRADGTPMDRGPVDHRPTDQAPADHGPMGETKETLHVQ